MFRRLFWILIGASFALWGRKKAADVTARYFPKVVVKAISSSIKGFIGGVAQSQKEAREAVATRNSS